MKKLLFTLLLIATQFCFASEQSVQHITIVESVDPVSRLRSIIYYYNNPNAFLISSRRIYGVEINSDYIFENFRDGRTRSYSVNSNETQMFPNHNSLPLMQPVVVPRQTILTATQSIQPNEQLRENLPHQPARAILISPTGFSSSLRPVPLTRQFATSDGYSETNSPRYSRSVSPMDITSDNELEENHNNRRSQ